MMSSIESRLPFLDFDLADFIISLPDAYKLRNGITKSILREGLKDFLPTEILNRHAKIGFATPDEIFVLNNQDTVRSAIVEAVNNTKGVLNQSIIDYFDEFTKNSFVK